MLRDPAQTHDSFTKCAECGGLLDEEDLFCSNCGLSVPETGQGDHPPLHSEELSHYFSCTSCGASMSYDASAQTLRCPFCGSAQLKAEAPARVLKADFAIPFSVERHQAEKILRTWMGSGFWRPGRLMTDAVITQMSPVFAPYWSFSAQTLTYWTADVAEGAIRGDCGPVTGHHQGTYRGLLVGASGVLTQQETTDLCPYELPACVPIGQVDLHQATVEQFTVPRKYARPQARTGIEEQEMHHCAGTYLHVRFRNLRVNVRIHDLTSEPIYLPVWITAYQYRGKTYRSLINGQSGRITGDAPFSTTKLAILVGVILLAILLLLATNVGR